MAKRKDKAQAERGRRGGKAVLKKYGKEHFRALAHASNQKQGKERK